LAALVEHELLDELICALQQRLWNRQAERVKYIAGSRLFSARSTPEGQGDASVEDGCRGV
jgi:hypothetical protein